jgi:hypothetical protein
MFRQRSRPAQLGLLVILRSPHIQKELPNRISKHLPGQARKDIEAQIRRTLRRNLLQKRLGSDQEAGEGKVSWWLGGLFQEALDPAALIHHRNSAAPGVWNAIHSKGCRTRVALMKSKHVLQMGVGEYVPIENPETGLSGYPLSICSKGTSTAQEVGLFDQ